MGRGERSRSTTSRLTGACRRGLSSNSRGLPDGYVATAADAAGEVARIGHELQPLEITRAGAASGRPDYVAAGCGIGREATLYLLDRGVRLTGTDGWSWDAPFAHTKEKYAVTGDAGLIWEGHKARLEIGYCHLEKLHDLEVLSPRRVCGQLFSGQDPRRLGRMDPRGRDHQQLNWDEGAVNLAALP